MRKILFRGKSIRGSWHIGLLAHIGNAWYISNKAGVATAFEIVPQTFGQYTGLKDRKGTDIFEGDIVYIIRAEEKGKVEWRENDAAFEVVGDCLEASFLENLYGHDVEVIGNIHDNPELLKEEG